MDGKLLLVSNAKDLSADEVPGQKTPVTGISAISQGQSAIFQSIGVRKPTARDAYTLSAD